MSDGFQIGSGAGPRPGPPDTLLSRNNLAGAYRSAGDLGRAIPLYEATLADRERVLGPDHPNTVVTRRKIAAVQSLRNPGCPAGDPA
ncbi:tetratricopeptide repeat protein [Nostocoides jenkinsii]|uniref:Tetratricopeptide repeat protein n=1 Tax=Nostocoides jenkinsii Ben 74 TaxID=1193518 RepID=A0A077MB14_9MICO|nr:tetratricopeptide repeat protein [Tetrasphaera jenkinsii]CCI52002.1 hypothetical protein BN13_1390001 [Tetrasphaera jenkinsii Ben 74]